MKRNQAEEVGESIMPEHRANLASAAEKKRSREARAAIRQRVGAGTLAGLAIGAAIGHFAAGGWYTAGFIGLGCGAAVGRILAGRQA